MAGKPFYRRRFLNRRGHHAGAYLIAECGTETYRDFPELSAYLTLADCGRVITLDFSGRSARFDRREARSRLRLLCKEGRLVIMTLALLGLCARETIAR